MVEEKYKKLGEKIIELMDEKGLTVDDLLNLREFLYIADALCPNESCALKTTMLGCSSQGDRGCINCWLMQILDRD